MTATTMHHRAAADPLRTVEMALLGMLFLGVVAMASLPAAIAGWAPLWLLTAPATALAASFALRLRRHAGRPARSAPAAVRRRRDQAVATRRRSAQPRRAIRLAALVLR